MELKPATIPYITGLFLNNKVPFSSLVNNIPVGILILDIKQRIILINQTLEALLGFFADEVKGLPCHSILRSKACIRSCPVLRMKESLDPISIESDLINCERQLIPVKITASPIINQKGKLLGYLEIIEDLRILQQISNKDPVAFSFEGIIGKSAEMEKIFRLLPVLAETDSSILITGETGTGKDLIAEAIHRASPRAKGPFIKVNCGALPETLLESELFGHVKGAFTGAVNDKPGRFRLANNGTLYLTEIGDLPLTLQVKLLTFLDDRVVYPIGSTRSYQVDVRIIAATHRNLEKMVAEGSFRKDLFYRLNVVRLHLPPLRERKEDIQMLLEHFMRLFAKKLNKRIKGFSPQALQKLKNYYYPGNVRELRNIVEYAINVCDKEMISLNHFPPYLLEEKQEKNYISIKTMEDTSKGVESSPKLDYKVTNNWSDIERKMILDALTKARGRRTEAAKLLGWARSTLWRKMKKYNLK